MNLTDEQAEIIDCNADTLVVDAFAGTGKTTTLVEYAKRRKNERMTYLAFNRSVKQEAEKKFPSNVRCVTTHGLAFPYFGTQYKHKLNNPRAYHLSSALGLNMEAAGQVIEVVNRFLNSPDSTIDAVHAFSVAPHAPANTHGMLVDQARKAWKMMQDTAATAIPMPHDGYLKLFQMNSPKINTQRILFDECQDANPITLDIVLKQKCNKVFIGDQYQSIYGFRGAVDALERLQADARFPLTTSFRFGSGVAKLATALLQDWRGCKSTIKGLGPSETVFKVDRNCPHAIISRTNSSLFAEAAALVNTTKPFGFIGGVDGYRFDQILETYFLFANRKGEIRDPFIKSFQDFKEMKQYGESLEDMEAKMLCKVVEEYTHHIPRLIGQIKAKAKPVLDGREITLTTTHKAKGLEWKNVVLADDYTDLEIKKDAKGRDVPPSNEEINILYVAVTRAMKGLSVPSSVYDWLFRTGKTDLLGMNEPLADEKQESSKAGTSNSTSSDFSTWVGDLDSYFDSLKDMLKDDAYGKANMATFLRRQADKFEGEWS